MAEQGKNNLGGTAEAAETKAKGTAKTTRKKPPDEVKENADA